MKNSADQTNKDNGHAHGLAHDWHKLINRRSVLAGGASLLLATPSLAQSICAPSPVETAGPFPADGSNRGASDSILNVLNDAGAFRADIRSSFGDYQGEAEGIPLALEIEFVNTNQNCTPIPELSIYVWQCDAPGRYSLYGLEDQNYLRGVQKADQSGTARFVTIFPGCYQGRWPHIHFEVFADLGEQTTVKDSLLISQFSFDRSVCEEIYKDARYGQSAARLSRLSIERDSVFRNNSAEEMVMQTMIVSQNADGTLTAKARVGLVL